MTALQSREDTREQSAAEVLLDAIPPLDPGASVLVIDDRIGAVGRELTGRRLKVTPWSRFASGSHPGQAWPAGGDYDAATLRLPRSKEALMMALHAATARLRPGAPLWVYGANDEGIKSAPGRMEPLLGPVDALDARRHCRVLEATRPETVPGLLGTLADFRRTLHLPLPDGEREVVSYPGVFAKGRLDPGTEMLLRALPLLEKGARVLDFACGAGIIAGYLARISPDAALWMTDADAIALAAAAENAPTATALCGDRWGAIQGNRQFDRIVSNPPIHEGKGRTYGVLNDLIEGAPARLRPGGQLWVVAQRQIPTDKVLSETFRKVTLAAEDGRYRVWSGQGRLRGGDSARG
jgi:16S rRNA (guanine1207-N2)-methyltransferase